MQKRRSILAAFTAHASIVLQVTCAGQRLASPIVVPFERAPPPYIVIRVPVATGSCEDFLFDTGTNTTLLAPPLAARVGLSADGAGVVEGLIGLKAAVTGTVKGIGFEDVLRDEPRVAATIDLPTLPGFKRPIAGVYGDNWLRGVDYLVDYHAKRIIVGPPGTLPLSASGHRTALSWAEGLPAVTAEIQAQGIEPFPARFVLDSGIDHVTLLGRAAERILAHGPFQSAVIDSGFGTRELPTARIMMNFDGHPEPAQAVLMADVKDREEDGLVPTSFFRSVFVSSAGGVVVFEPTSPAVALERTVCDAVQRRRE